MTIDAPAAADDRHVESRGERANRAPTLGTVIARGNVRELANVMERTVVLAQRPDRCR
jgi:DNA-binding NtrC family response regulator